jgi:hypothetical protein
MRGNHLSDRFVGTALGVSLFALTSIIVGVGQLSRREMDRLHADARRIAEQQWLDVQLANRALSLSNRNSHINMQIILSDNRSEINTLLLQRAENSVEISRLLARLQARVGSEEEQNSLDAILAARKPYLESYQKITGLLRDQKKEEAVKLWKQETLALLLRYHSAFHDFAQYQTDEMNEELARSAVRYSSARGGLYLGWSSRCCWRS